MFCLLPKLANEFLKKIKSGELDPVKLAEVSSAERRTYFESFMDKGSAKEVNMLFEKGLGLKNQQLGMINWVKQVSGMKPEAVRSTLEKVNKMTELLNPKDLQAFKEDLVAHKLNATVTLEEAALISKLGKRVAESKTKIDRTSNPGDTSRMEYGRNLVDFLDYAGELKLNTAKLSIKDRLNPTNYVRNVSDLAGFAKSMKAALDNSVVGRQGLKVAFTNPRIWLKNSRKSFADLYNVGIKNKDVMREVRAEVLSRENSLNGMYEKEKLAVGTIEEAFPSTLPERIPVVKRAFKASESAFTAFQYRTRADLFDRYVEIAKKSGADNIQGIGKVANSLTGRGTFGQRGESAASLVNNVFFSPRLLKSHVDLLAVHAFDKGISPFARKLAAKNMLKVVAGVASIMVLADAVAPGSIEKDPRSSDFGKIKVKDTRFDVTGGMASLTTLAARIAFGSTKSTTTGKVTKLNARGKNGEPVFGAQTRTSLLANFFENKLSPLAGVIRDIANNADYSGEKPTVAREVRNLFLPLPINTYLELKKNPNSANILASMIADGLGISTNTYSPQKKK